MVIDGDELLGDLILWLAIAALIALCLVVASGVLLARLVHGKVTPRTVALGMVVSISAAVFAIVAWRLVGAGMTRYDALWGLGAVAVGTISWRTLRRSKYRSAPPAPVESTAVD